MLRLLADKYQHVTTQFLLCESLMNESHVSWMTVLHCYIMWFHKSRGTKNTIHIRSCLFSLGERREEFRMTTTCAIVAYHHLSWEFEPHSWRGVLDKILCDKVCQWLATGLWISLGTPISARKGVTKIFLKVVLNTSPPMDKWWIKCLCM